MTLCANDPAPTTRTFCSLGFSKIFFTSLRANPLTDKEFSPILVSVLAFFEISITLSDKKAKFLPTIPISFAFLKADLN